jgi:hypothetical protein
MLGLRRWWAPSLAPVMSLVRALLLFIVCGFGLAVAGPRGLVLIVADDHRYDALGFLGHPFVETPHLDRLAREGVHAARAFVTTALFKRGQAVVRC